MKNKEISNGIIKSNFVKKIKEFKPFIEARTDENYFELIWKIVHPSKKASPEMWLWCRNLLFNEIKNLSVNLK